MNVLFTLAFVLSLSFSSQAQLLDCEWGRSDTSACARALDRAFHIKKGQLQYRNAPVQRVCSSGDTFTIAFGDSEYYRKAGFKLYCEEMSLSKPFNNTFKGVKEGLWFKYTLLGNVKSAIKYDSGRVHEMITFWPNGLPKRQIRYKLTGEPVVGGRIDYKRE